MEEVSSVEWNRGTQCGARSRCHHLNSISLNPSFQPPTTGIIARPRITILHSIPLSVNVYESNSTAIFSLSSGCVACLPAPPQRRRLFLVPREPLSISSYLIGPAINNLGNCSQPLFRSHLCCRCRRMPARSILEPSELTTLKIV